MNKIIIGQPWGGLGDNLQFSTIPELAHEFGIECYVSTKNTYRNQQTKSLVWDLNPYVKFTDEEPNIGEHIPATGNIISDWEIKLFALARNRTPKIYYKPNLITNLKERVLLDVNSVSAPCDFTKVLDKYRDKNIILINPPKETNTDGYEVVYSHSIFEYTDMIYSCFHFISQYSGGSVLSAALGKSTEVYMKDELKKNNYYNFDMHSYNSI